MRRWRLALGVAVVLGLAVWVLGVGSNGTQPTGIAAVVPKLRPVPSTEPSPLDRAISEPAGKPQVTLAFTGDRLDLSTWDTCYPYMDLPTGCTNFGNPEYQWYLPSQVHVSHGDLHLVAQRIRTAGTTKRGTPHEYYCRSGMVTTYPGLQFKYGYLQVVARIPAGRGLWPALWLAAANESWPPEIDILEAWGTSKAGEFLHPVGGSSVREKIPPKLAFGWHTFALDWTKSKITWLIDGKVMLSASRHIPHQKMYLIMNVAESVRPKQRSDCTGTMLVKSVKLWRNASGPASS